MAWLFSAPAPAPAPAAPAGSLAELRAENERLVVEVSGLTAELRTLRSDCERLALELSRERSLRQDQEQTTLQAFAELEELRRPLAEAEETKRALLMTKTVLAQTQLQLKAAHQQLATATQQKDAAAAAKEAAEATAAALVKAEAEARAQAQEAEKRDAEEKQRQREAEATRLVINEATKKLLLEHTKMIYEATSGLTVNEVKLIRAICPLDNEKLQLLQQLYMSQFGADLKKVVTKSTSGYLRTLLLGLLETRLSYSVLLLKNSMGLMTTDEQVLADLLCAADNAEIQALKTEFKKLAGKELIESVEKATKNELQRYLVILLQGKRDTSATVDEGQVKADAAALFNAGQGKTLGVDSAPFLQIVGNRSAQHLVRLNTAYAATNKQGLSLIAAISKLFSGVVRRALISTIEVLSNKSQYYCDSFYEAFRGVGCDEAHVLRIITLRKDVDMPTIKTLYDAKYSAEKVFSARLGQELSLTPAILSNLARAALFACGEGAAAAAGL